MVNVANQRVIDCDVHCTVPSIRALSPYLSDYWIEMRRLDLAALTLPALACR